MEIKQGEMTLQEIEDLIIKNNGHCVHCHRKIKKGSIRSYDHDGGIYVKNKLKKQWVYFHCYWCFIDSSVDKVIRMIQAREKYEL